MATNDACELIAMMRPEPWASITRPAAWAVKNRPLLLTAVMVGHRVDDGLDRPDVGHIERVGRDGSSRGDDLARDSIGVRRNVP